MGIQPLLLWFGIYVEISIHVVFSDAARSVSTFVSDEDNYLHVETQRAASGCIIQMQLTIPETNKKHHLSANYSQLAGKLFPACRQAITGTTASYYQKMTLQTIKSIDGFLY